MIPMEISALKTGPKIFTSPSQLFVCSSIAFINYCHMLIILYSLYHKSALGVETLVQITVYV